MGIAEQKRGFGWKLPGLFLLLDFTRNRNFHARLTEFGVKHDYREIPGKHDWATVLAALPAMFDFANKYFTSAP